MIERIIVSPEAESYPLTSGIIAGFPEAQVVMETGSPATLPEDQTGYARNTLRLEVFKGPFLKPCPCSRGVLGCGYLVLSPLIGCPFSCSYCVLDNYINAPCITAYVNLEDLFSQVVDYLDGRPHQQLRIGTGEMADSLALEPGLGMARSLVEFFSDKQNTLFELKTKSDTVDPLLEIAHGGRTVIGFSLNPDYVVEEEERGAAFIEERIRAAAKAERAGYRLAFHFDPVIDLKPTRPAEISMEAYRRPINMIYDSVPRESIAWISLGSLRFTPRLFHKLREEKPGRNLLLGELLPGFDTKVRYLRRRRRALLEELAKMIRARDPKAPLYLCMEDKGMTESVLGKSFFNSNGS